MIAIKFSFHAYPLSKEKELKKKKELRRDTKSSLLERYKSAKKRIRCTSVHRIGHQRDCIYIGFNSHCNREYCVRRTSASKDAVKCDR